MVVKISYCSTHHNAVQHELVDMLNALVNGVMMSNLFLLLICESLNSLHNLCACMVCAL